MCDKKHYEDLERKMKIIEDQQKELMGTVGKSSDDVVKMVKHFLDDMEEVKVMVNDHLEATKDIKDAWDSAGGLAKFVKWLAVLIASCAVIYGAFKDVLFWKIGG